MVNILPLLLNQVALYWDVGALTESGRRDYSSVTPIEVACHWDVEVTRLHTNDGEIIKSTSRIITSTEVKEYGVLWLSTAKVSDPAGTALLQTPASVPTNQTINVVETHHSIHADETLYKAYV